ncbi:RNP1 [Symbiodinium sp. CCMP2592]|nr:RNP1 [Symbiodinium sp. CCMP2592]
MSIAAQAARNVGGCVPNKIHVSGVPTTVTKDQFVQYFAQYGAIAKADLVAARGFGFITYNTVEAVDAVEREEHHFGRKQVKVQPCVPRERMAAYETEKHRLSTAAPKAAEKLAVPPKAVATAPSGGKGNSIPGSGWPRIGLPGKPSSSSMNEGADKNEAENSAQLPVPTEVMRRLMDHAEEDAAMAAALLRDMDPRRSPHLS